MTYTYPDTQLIDVLAANARLINKLQRFRAWQTNYPASRPELIPMLDEMEEFQLKLEKGLQRLREEHGPTLVLEKEIERFKREEVAS